MYKDNNFSFKEIINYGVDNLSIYDDYNLDKCIKEIEEMEKDLEKFHTYFNKIKSAFLNEKAKRLK